MGMVALGSKLLLASHSANINWDAAVVLMTRDVTTAITSTFREAGMLKKV